MRNARWPARSWKRAAALGVVVSLLLSPVAAEAQYFGRNKVNWQRFDFRILQAPRFDVYFYPAESLATMDMARMAERWYDRLSPFLRHQMGRRSLIFFADQADFQQNNIVDIEGEGTGGVTEGFRQRVVMPLTGVYADNNHVLGHELVHVFQYDISRNPVAQAGEGAPGGTTTARGGGIGLHALPLWFVEGMAEYLSLGRTDPNTAMWMRDAVRRDDLPTVRQMTTDMRYFPYRYGQAFWAYIGGRFGDRTVVDLFRAALRTGIEPAFRSVLRMTTDSLSREWAAATRAYYQPTLAGRTPPEELGTRLVVQRARRGGGEYNISPAISPDGRHVAFFSSRALFAMQILIADAETGRIVARLGSINTPQHFDALSFLSSPGSWSPDGERLAYVVYHRGNQVIDIYNMRTRRSERTITAPGVGAALDPAWSPDGRYLAFSGMAGGISNLYLYDLETNETQQLTTGRNATIQPSWSPDGSTLVFTTDMGPATDFMQLTFGPMRLATYTIATRQIQLLPMALGDAKAINPHYSPDGASIYFISDADGVSDLYRYEIGPGALFRVTQVASGISGISRLSSAMSVSRQTGRVVFSLFRGHGYDIVRLDPNQLVGTPFTAPAAAVAGVLPPVPTTPGAVQMYLADAATGLVPEPVAYRIVPYRARLSLEYLAPPAVGVGVGGPFGTQVSGGIAGLFRDMLGNHNLVGILQAEGEVRDLGGQVVYTNLQNRWNFGATAGRIPYRTGFSFRQDLPEGPVINQVIRRVFFNQIGAFAQYPFSPTHRVELGAQATRQSESWEVDRFLLGPAGVIAHVRERLPAPPAVTYTQGIAAFVGDYSFFGLTSPIAGSRYRLEVSPVFGGLQFQTTLADYRRYFYLRPFTFAGRAMQYNRLGRDAEDMQRLSPVFVGQPWFVRGYDPGDFRGAECVVVAGDGPTQCPVFDRLIGSRIAVANLELRVPLLGPYGFGVIPTRLLPVEIAPFGDMGWAWTRDEGPRFTFAGADEARTTLDRIPVFSAGVTARTNLFGFAVLELYYAYPFQRPDRGAHFGFQIAPGW